MCQALIMLDDVVNTRMRLLATALQELTIWQRSLVAVTLILS